MNFRELGLIDPILKALEQEGYTTPTPIQQGAIPRRWRAGTCWAAPRRARQDLRLCRPHFTAAGPAPHTGPPHPGFDPYPHP